MAVQNIFAPESIEGSTETAKYVEQIHQYLDSLQLSPIEFHPYIYSRALRQSCKAVLTGARGVGCVITNQHNMDPQKFVAEGCNDLANDNSDWAHVAHAEVLTIQKMRKRNRLRKERGKKPFDPLESTLWSTLGPCPMCMISAINQRIRHVVTIAPDWTGGVTMEQLAKTYAGFGKYVNQFDLQSFDAPVDLVSQASEAQRMRQLCWAISRIKNYHFDVDEFSKNQDLLTHDALSDHELTRDSLLRRLESTRVKIGMSPNHSDVRYVLQLIEDTFGNLESSEPIFSVS